MPYHQEKKLLRAIIIVMVILIIKRRVSDPIPTPPPQVSRHAGAVQRAEAAWNDTAMNAVYDPWRRKRTLPTTYVHNIKRKR